MTILRHRSTFSMLIAVLTDDRPHGSQRNDLPKERLLASRRFGQNTGRPSKGVTRSRAGPLAPLAKGRVANQWRQRKTCVRSAATTHSRRRRPVRGGGSGGASFSPPPSKMGPVGQLPWPRPPPSALMPLAFYGMEPSQDGPSVLLRRPWHGCPCSSGAAGRRFPRSRIRTCATPLSTVLVAQRRPTSRRHVDSCDQEHCVGQVVAATTRPADRSRASMRRAGRGSGPVLLRTAKGCRGRNGYGRWC